MRRSRRVLHAAVAATCTAVVAAVPASGSAFSSAPALQTPGTLLETLTVPGTAHVANGPLLKTTFQAGKEYTLVISGVVDLSPSASYPVDPVYCFVRCNPPSPIGFVQLTWFRGSTYSHFTTFGVAARPAYNPAHSYQEKIKPGFTARLRVGVGGFDTDARDNTGSFTVQVYGPRAASAKPPAARAPRWPVPRKPSPPAKEKKIATPAANNYLQFDTDPWFRKRRGDPSYEARLCLGSNASWLGASELPLGPGGGSSVQCEWAPGQIPSAWVWSRDCPRTPHDVVFTRVFYALGEPSYATFNGTSRSAEITKVVLNGKVLTFEEGRVRPSLGGDDLSAESRKAFRPLRQANRLEVHARGACGDPDAGPARVAFDLVANFRANLKGTVTRKIPAETVYQFDVEVTNLGPSDAVAIGFRFAVDVEEFSKNWEKYPPPDAIKGFTGGIDTFKCDFTNVHGTPLDIAGGPDPTFRAALCHRQATLVAGESFKGLFLVAIRPPVDKDGQVLERFLRKFVWEWRTSTSYAGSAGPGGFGSGGICRPRCTR